MQMLLIERKNNIVTRRKNGIRQASHFVGCSSTTLAAVAVAATPAVIPAATSRGTALHCEAAEAVDVVCPASDSATAASKTASSCVSVAVTSAVTGPVLAIGVTVSSSATMGNSGSVVAVMLASLSGAATRGAPSAAIVVAARGATTISAVVKPNN